MAHIVEYYQEISNDMDGEAMEYKESIKQNHARGIGGHDDHEEIEPENDHKEFPFSDTSSRQRRLNM